MSDVRSKRRADALRADIVASRHRVEIDAEAVAFRTDVRARAKDALEDGKDKLLATLAHTFDVARESIASAATTAQEGAADMADRARPHVEAAVESVQATAAKVGTQVADVAHEAAERLAPVADSLATAAQTVASAAQDAKTVASDALETGKDALAAGKDALAKHDAPPAIDVTGA